MGVLAVIAREALRVGLFISSLVLLPLTCDRDRSGDPGTLKSLYSAMKRGGLLAPWSETAHAVVPNGPGNGGGRFRGAGRAGGGGQTMPITGVVEGHGPVTTR